MLYLSGLLLGLLAARFKSRALLEAEILIVRHLLGVLRRQALGLGASQREPAFASVRIVEGTEASANPPSADSPPAPAAPPVIVERSTPGVEIELIGGRRVRFDRDIDPETVRRLVSVLEGERS